MPVVSNKKKAEQAVKAAAQKAEAAKVREAENALYAKGEGKAASSAEQEPKMSEKAAAAKAKALEGIPAGCLEALKDRLGLDLSSPKIGADVIWGIRKGNVVGPVEVEVVPTAYDRETKKRSEMPAIKALVSLRVGLPFKGGEIVAPDKKNKLYIQTFPVRPLVLREDGQEEGQQREAQAAPAEEKKGGKKKDPTFSDAQIKALEGAGVEPDRLFGGHNFLSKEEKQALLDGESVEISGAVKNAYGDFINIHGEVSLGKKDAKFDSVVMRTLADRTKVPALASIPNEEFETLKGGDFMVDILGASRQGQVDFDVFMRDSDGKVFRDSKTDTPVLNEAARNIISYGSSMGAVTGWFHGKDDKPARHDYVITVVNGSFVAEPMEKVPTLDRAGKPVVREVWSAKKKKVVEEKVTHPEVKWRNIITDENKVRVDGMKEPLAFRDEYGFADFAAGRPAVVIGAEMRNFKTGKTETFDGAVVYDPARYGARLFTPSTSKKLDEKIKQEHALKEKARKGLRFSKVSLG